MKRITYSLLAVILSLTTVLAVTANTPGRNRTASETEATAQMDNNPAATDTKIGLQSELTDIYIIGSNVNGHSWELELPECQLHQIKEGIFAWTGEYLGTGFKFNDGTWSIGGLNLGGDGTELSLGETYSIVEGGGNIGFSDFEGVKNPYVELDLNNYTILVTGEKDGAIMWYFSGDFNDWNLTQYCFEESGDGEMSVKNVPLPAVGSFKVSTTGWAKQYGSNYDDIVITPESLSATLEYVKAEIGECRFSLEPGEYNITWNPQTAYIEFELVSGGIVTPPVTPPFESEDIYIIGSDVNGHVWELAPDDCKLEAVSDGVYEWKGEYLGTGFKFNDGTWNGLNIGGDTFHNLITLGKPCYVIDDISSSNLGFTDCEGIRNPIVQLDLNKYTVMVEGEKVGHDNWYFTGDFNSWNLTEYRFEKTADGQLTVSNITLPGVGIFKISTLGWVTQYGSYSDEDIITSDCTSAKLDFVQNGETGCMFNIKPGKYDIIWYPETAWIVFKPLFGSEIETPVGPGNYYIIGTDINGHTWELGQPDAMFTQVSEYIYKWNGKELGSGFKINDGTWDNFEVNYGSNGSPLLLGEPYYYQWGELADNIYIDQYPLIINPEVILDIYNGTVTVSGTPQGEYSYEWYITGLAGDDDNQFADRYILAPVSGKENVFSAKNVIIDKAGDFKVCNDGYTNQYGLYNFYEEINDSNLGAQLAPQPVNINGMPFDLHGTYDITWDLNNEYITFVKISDDTTPQLPTVAALTVNTINGTGMKTSLPGGTTITLQFDIDGYWSIVDYTVNGEPATLPVDGNTITLFMDADKTLEVELAYNGTLEWIQGDTGVAYFEGTNLTIAVNAEGGVTVSGLNNGDEIVVYNLAGQIVERHFATAEQETCHPEPGIYIVRVNDCAAKLNIR